MEPYSLSFDLVALLDGSFAEIGRALSDDQLAHLEAVIAFCQALVMDHPEGSSLQSVTIEDSALKSRALLVDARVVCIDLLPDLRPRPESVLQREARQVAADLAAGVAS